MTRASGEERTYFIIGVALLPVFLLVLAISNPQKGAFAYILSYAFAGVIYFRRGKKHSIASWAIIFLSFVIQCFAIYRVHLNNHIHGMIIIAFIGCFLELLVMYGLLEIIEKR